MHKLLQLLENVISWDDLKIKLDLIEVARLRGYYFEVFIKYLITCDPRIKDDYKEVFLFNEIPFDFKNILFPNSTIEKGVDLLAIDNANEKIAIQCKYRKDESTKLGWNNDGISNFIAYGRNADKFLLISNASDVVDEAKNLVKEGKFFHLNIDFLQKINPTLFAEIVSKLKGNNLTRQIYSPRQHQEEAIKAAVQYFELSDRGKLILPCGAGKTLTGLWIKENLKAKNTLVLVPSLALLKQIKDQWAEQRSDFYNYICVCSEKDIITDDKKNYDSLVMHTYEIDAFSTTNPDEIKKFLINSSSSKTVFSTYQSLPSIKEAISDNNFIFDLAICDEAHRTTGIDKMATGFTLIHNQIPCKKILYMTATPRIFKQSLKDCLDDNYFSMEDEEKYGKEIYRMSFKEAIDQEILCDYKIIAVGVSNEELHKYIEDRNFVNDNTSADELANNVALNKVMKNYEASHAITFHSRIKSAEKFAYRHNYLFENIFSKSISGKLSTFVRNQILRNFINTQTAVITNARCLSEGVDLPGVDIVYYCDPKNSKIDIIQSSGRVLRKNKFKPNKIGLIVIPIFHKKEEDLSKSIDEGIFKNLINVIRALSDQDERLEIEITQLRFNKEKRNKHLEFDFAVDPDVSEKIVLIDFEKRLENYLFEQVVAKASSSWEYNFLRYKEFKLSYPNREPSQRSNDQNEKQLGIWHLGNKNLFNAGLLSEDRLRKLIEINYPLNRYEEKWLNKFNELKKWLIDHNEAFPRQGKDKLFPEFEANNELNMWCRYQQRSYNSLNENQKKLLESINFINFINYDHWEEKYLKLENYYRKNNSYPTYHIKNTMEENALSAWCASLRRRKDKLSADQIKRLNEINFIWDSRIKDEERWQEQFEKLKEFRAINPDKWPSQTAKNNEEKKLGQWCNAQRQRYKGTAGKAYQNLDEGKIKKLESIGFPWEISKSTTY